jgi:CRISPR-associated protein Csm2
MNADPTGSELVSYANSVAERLVRDGLTRSQIRGIFTEVRRIESLWSADPQVAERRLNMLKPKLDYQSNRHASVSHLREVLNAAIDEVGRAAETEVKNERFQRFVDLFEAILAYHRAFGGRN